VFGFTDSKETNVKPEGVMDAPNPLMSLSFLSNRRPATRQGGSPGHLNMQILRCADWPLRRLRPELVSGSGHRP